MCLSSKPTQSLGLHNLLLALTESDFGYDFSKQPTQNEILDHHVKPMSETGVHLLISLCSFIINNSNGDSKKALRLYIHSKPLFFSQDVELLFEKFLNYKHRSLTIASFSTHFNKNRNRANNLDFQLEDSLQAILLGF